MDFFGDARNQRLHQHYLLLIIIYHFLAYNFLQIFRKNSSLCIKLSFVLYKYIVYNSFTLLAFLLAFLSSGNFIKHLVLYVLPEFVMHSVLQDTFQVPLALLENLIITFLFSTLVQYFIICLSFSSVLTKSPLNFFNITSVICSSIIQCLPTISFFCFFSFFPLGIYSCLA